MATTPSTALDRIAGFALTLMFCLCLCVSAQGQGASPLVTSSSVTALPAPPTYGAVWASAISSHGDFIIADFENAAIYEYPAGGGGPITIYASGKSGPGGMWANSGITLDKYDNLWIDNNWNGGLQLVPYDSVNHVWNTSGQSVQGNIGAASIYYYQAVGLAANASGTFVMSSECCSPGLLEWTQDQSGNATNIQTVINTTTARARTVAIDTAGNIYLFEDGGQPGILMVPAGTVGLANDKSLVDVEPVAPATPGATPTPFLSNITGAAVDANGNLYVGDSAQGIFMIPNQGGTLNPAAWVLISPMPANGQVSLTSSIDGILVPTIGSWNGVSDVGRVSLGSAELGSSPVGTPAATNGVIYYAFSDPDLIANPNAAGDVTPARFVIQEDGVATPDFAVTSGGTCAVGTTYPISATKSSNPVFNCTLDISFNPQRAGSISAQLLMQTKQTSGSTTTYTTVATTLLHGTGLASEITTTPAAESLTAGSLKTPSQVATDTMGNLYVADSGSKQVLMYAAGSTLTTTPVGIGTGLTSPTGVAVDGAGDVFIADSGAGSIVEVPFVNGALNAAGQLTLASNLGTGLTLAADGLGHLFASDPINGRIVEINNVGSAQGTFGQAELFLTSGFKNPSYVAVDSANNLYVIDGVNLYEVTPAGTTTLANNLSGATSVAVDPSGAVFIASAGGTMRIPFVSGALNPSGSTPVATSVTSPMALAIDNMGNVYVADGTALDVDVVTPSGTLDFGNVALGNTPTLDATVTNAGNGSLSVTGYTSTNALDFTGADGTCMGNSPVASGDTCQVAVTLAPGPGEQGSLAGQIGITSNAVNTPVVISAVGIGAPLAISQTSVTVGTSAEVVNTPVTVTVQAQGGGAVPTGQVKVTYTTFTVTNGANGPTITPSTTSQMATLSNGTATLTLNPVLAGSNTISVTYEGDRVYGRSTGSASASIGKSAIANMAFDKNPPPYLPYVLQTNNGFTPYDTSPTYWEYSLPVTVTTPSGMPTGTITFNDSSTTSGYTGVACPNQSGAAVQTLSTTGTAKFATGCLPSPYQTGTQTLVMDSTHTITPVYSGDANFQSFTGQPTTFIVVRSPALLMAAAPASISMAAGSSASTNVSLTSILGYGFAGKGGQLNNYDFPVSLACSTLPPHSNCTITYPNPDPNIPTAVDIPCTGTTAAADNCQPGNVTVTVNTNVATGTTTAQLVHPASMAYAAVFGFGIFGLFFRRRLGKGGRMMLMICLAIVGGILATSLTACSTTNLSPATQLTTPKGTYQVSVTAVQVGSQVITLPTGPITIYGSNNQVSLPYAITVNVQ